MTRQANLDRLAQLDDERLAAVVRCVEQTMLFGKGWLSRSGQGFTAESDEEMRARTQRRLGHREHVRVRASTWREEAEQAKQRYAERLANYETGTDVAAGLSFARQTFERLRDEFRQEYPERAEDTG